MNKLFFRFLIGKIIPQYLRQTSIQLRKVENYLASPAYRIIDGLSEVGSHIFKYESRTIRIAQCSEKLHMLANICEVLIVIASTINVNPHMGIYRSRYGVCNNIITIDIELHLISHDTYNAHSIVIQPFHKY